MRFVIPAAICAAILLSCGVLTRNTYDLEAIGNNLSALVNRDAIATAANLPKAIHGPDQDQEAPFGDPADTHHPGRNTPGNGDPDFEEIIAGLAQTPPKIPMPPNDIISAHRSFRDAPQGTSTGSNGNPGFQDDNPYLAANRPELGGRPGLNLNPSSNPPGTTIDPGSITDPSTPSNPGATPVPEPATVLLLGTGLIGIAAITRKKLLNT